MTIHVRTRACLVALLAVLGLLIAGSARADTFIFASSGPITISGLTPTTAGSPYPSTIAVSGVTGTVTDVNVTLGNLTKPIVALLDLDFLLVSPTGKKMILWSDAGFGTASNLTLTFDDQAAAPIGQTTNPVVSGTYKPTNYGPYAIPCGGELDPDVFTPPAPAGPYDSTLSIFNGDDPNGTWSLYPVVDCLGSGSATLGNWAIAFTTTPTVARMASFTAARANRGVTVRWRTASEVDVAGFNVYRVRAGAALRKVNRTLIAARGGVGGASYRFVDRSARAGVAYTYRLQVVDLDGTRAWYGSARVRANRQ